MLTDEQVEEIRTRKSKAHQMVSDLCKPRGTEGARSWLMSIPADRERDPDLVIADALRDIPALLADRKEMRKLLREAVTKIVPQFGGRYEIKFICQDCDEAGKTREGIVHDPDCFLANPAVQELVK